MRSERAASGRAVTGCLLFIIHVMRVGAGELPTSLRLRETAEPDRARQGTGAQSGFTPKRERAHCSAVQSAHTAP